MGRRILACSDYHTHPTPTPYPHALFPARFLVFLMPILLVSERMRKRMVPLECQLENNAVRMGTFFKVLRTKAMAVTVSDT